MCGAITSISAFSSAVPKNLRIAEVEIPVAFCQTFRKARKASKNTHDTHVITVSRSPLGPAGHQVMVSAMGCAPWQRALRLSSISASWEATGETAHFAPIWPSKRHSDHSVPGSSSCVLYTITDYNTISDDYQTIPLCDFVCLTLSPLGWISFGIRGPDGFHPWAMRLWSQCCCWRLYTYAWPSPMCTSGWPRFVSKSGSTPRSWPSASWIDSIDLRRNCSEFG